MKALKKMMQVLAVFFLVLLTTNTVFANTGGRFVDKDNENIM